LHITYGSHSHPTAEANLVQFDAIERRSPRGHRIETTYRAHVVGELIYDGQGNLHPRIAELIAAYGIPNQSFTFRHDDGTPTSHRIPSDAEDPNNITGVRIIHRNWPKGDPAEYATLRTFYLVVEATFRDPEDGVVSPLVDFHQSVESVGIAGIRRRWIEYDVGSAEEQLVNQLTTQRLIQSGYAVGYSSWPTPPGPLFPDNELTDLRRVRTDWSYVMESPTFQTGEPTNQ
jgi:hypothetical protein